MLLLNYAQNINKSNEDPSKPTKEILTAMGIMVLLYLILWFWALIALIKFWGNLNTGLRIVAVLGLLGFGDAGPFITLLAVYSSV